MVQTPKAGHAQADGGSLPGHPVQPGLGFLVVLGAGEGEPLFVGTDLGESHTFQYTIDISPPPKKKKTKPAKQRVSITPEERAQRRRAYEQARNQLPHRRELKRRKEKERHEQAKELGLCRTCRSPAIPGQTRCKDCALKRRLQQIQAREKAIQQKQGTLGQPPLF